ncbi:MAG: serine protease [Treponema sp.]|jgi:serine protease Do|nr:serine protease [Treponema sp.]
MNRKFLICLILGIFILPSYVFSQQTATTLRNYVGLINQSYHPGIVTIFEKTKESLEKRGEARAVLAIDLFLRGATGSGFIYSDARGNLYLLTNNHVVDQAFTLAVTFEFTDGTKTRIENLSIIATDEENDLAILSFPENEKPVRSGLTFLTRQIQEGEDVFSAGFPGLGATPIWQFGRGMVSNASVRFPKSYEDETLMGPFIQHTAQVDPGNSGGPLLVPQANAPAGYAVAGINTLSGLRRQAANYAIPINTVNTFIENSLNPKPETFRAALDERLFKFIEELNSNKTHVFPYIADYLSTTCVGENAEFAMTELYDKANSAIRRIYIDKFDDSVVGAMGYAVAWTIENSVRNRDGIKASIKEVKGRDEEYFVTFTINNKDVNSVWVREYGNWRIRSFDTVASGDTSRVSRREAQREAAGKLRLGSLFHIETGYAYLFDLAPAAAYICMELAQISGMKFYYAGPDYWALGFFSGYRADIPIKNFGFMPFIRLGVDYQRIKNNVFEEMWDFDSDNFDKDTEYVFVWPLAFNLQAGFKLTSSYVPGLFLGVTYQVNWVDTVVTLEEFRDKLMRQGVSFSVGYAF